VTNAGRSLSEIYQNCLKNYNESGKQLGFINTLSTIIYWPDGMAHACNLANPDIEIGRIVVLGQPVQKLVRPHLNQ
jgi:hypothetical protein